ncbi:hypothetical protein [Streptomyces nogalater]|uniref:Uncharacterized protein n=1 Tax=Streptomyces nogalater TaxID=38314 RepID=A0ABW0W7R0_STRNO
MCSYETQTLKDTLRLSYDAVRRGVRLRTLYPHSARCPPSFRAILQQNLDSGAEVRTSDEAQHFIIIVDQETAFLPTDSSDGGTSAVTVVYEPAIVKALCGIYRNTWQPACVAVEREGGDARAAHPDGRDQLGPETGVPGVDD